MAFVQVMNREKNRLDIADLLQKTIFNAEALRWVIVGVVATGLHYGIYYIMLQWVAMPYNGAYACGYVGSLIFNYVASVRFAFKTTFGWLKTLKFLGSHAINCALHFLLLNLFIWLGLSELVAPVLVLCIVVPINFFLVRFALKNTFIYGDEKDSSADSLL